MNMRTCFEWTDEKAPSQFLIERSKDNHQYLSSVLGKNWLAKTLSFPSHRNHPLTNVLTQFEPSSFLRMNLLAEDLRILEKTDGLEQVLNDLRHSDRCLPSWHVINSAALFARASGQSITRFFEQDEIINPDFEVSTQNGLVAIEAKYFMESESQIEFGRRADPIARQVIDQVLSQPIIHPIVTILIRNPDFIPPIDYLLACVRTALKGFGGAATFLTTPHCNVIIQPCTLPLRAMSTYRCCLVLSLRSANENLRVESRAKHASKQLSDISAKGKPSILCLRIGQKQTLKEIQAILTKRFNKNHLGNISSVMVTEPSCHSHPVHGHFINQVVGLFANHTAQVQLQGDLKMHAHGQINKWDDVIEEVDVVPVYNYGIAEGKGNGQFAISCPDYRHFRTSLVW